MTLIIPTTQELKNRNLANLEAALNQNSPLNEKAFLRVLAAIEALAETGLYKFAVERTKQVLGLTAFGAGLDAIGSEYGVVRKPAEAAILRITALGTSGTVIPATVNYVGDANKVRYLLDSSQTVGGGGFISFDVTAETLGVVGNLNLGDFMTVGTQIAGVDSSSPVTGIINVGAEAETDDAYRARVLNAVRATPGGGNAVDHKIWAEEVAGVERAYPYAGEPDSPLPGVLLSSVPADRVVFVESTTDINQDGIPPGSLLTEVRDSINTDPVTGASRPPLGLVDSTLFVEVITRTQIFILITNFDEGTGDVTTIKANIETALTQHLFGLRMFVPAIDLPAERNDLITEVTLSDVVQGVLNAGDGSAEQVQFGETTGVGTPLTSYQLDAGELAKLGATGGIVYVP